MKTYSNRSNAVRAAKAAHGAEYEQHVKVMLAVDGKGFNLVPCAPLAAPAALVAPVAAPAAPVADDDSASVSYYQHHNLTHCPGCKIHLSNGVLDFDSCVDAMGDAHKAWLEQSKEYSCMGCGFEFGADIDEPGKAKPNAHTGTGIKIQKDRPEQNGIKRPSAGGACAAVWDFCDSVMAKGAAPTAKEVKAWAAEGGTNPNNAVIEFYQWRKFNGIVGRAPKA